MTTYKYGVSKLKEKVELEIWEAIKAANNSAGPFDYIRLVKDGIRSRMGRLKSSLPAYLVAISIAERLDHNITFNFECDVKRGTIKDRVNSTFGFTGPDGQKYTVLYNFVILDLKFQGNPLDKFTFQETGINDVAPSLHAFSPQPKQNPIVHRGGIDNAILVETLGEALKFTEKHFNGTVGTLGLASDRYNKVPNHLKRTYSKKISQLTNVKAGQIFQGAKGISKSAGKLATKFGPAGTVLGVGVIGYELYSDTWDAHTIGNGALIVGAGVATFFCAPAVLTGIAIYGVGDYFFDLNGIVDKYIGRKANVWK